MAQEAKLKILAIHGYRQSDTTFSGKLGSLRKSFKQKVEFRFIRAPHLVPPLEDAGEHEEPAAEGYGWWFNTKNHYFKATEPSDLSVGSEESVALIERTFRESGPFDGLIGFSQGASFVANLCAMQQKNMSPIKFKFAILVSGFKSLCQPHVFLYDEQLSLPTLHVYGESDKIIPTEMCKDLAAMFDNRKEVTHEGGHYVPGKKQIYDDFITEMFESKKTVG